MKSTSAAIALVVCGGAAVADAYHVVVAASPRFRTRQRAGYVVSQDTPPDPAAEPEPELPAAEPAAETSVKSSYLEEQKKTWGFADASDGEDASGTRLAVPSFFAGSEEEKPGAARGVDGLNDQGYEPYDPKALDSSTVDTKPVFIALAVSSVVIAALSAGNLIG